MVEENNMAQIDIEKIEKLDKDRNTIHEKVYTTYSSFDKFGEHYFQIDTYGKNDRDLPGKISQSLQLDSETARFVYEMLKNEFNF